MCDHPPVPAKISAPHSAKPFASLRRPYAMIIANVDLTGRVTATQIDVSSGDVAYDAAAASAMKSWTFVPAAASCKPIPGESEYAVGGSDRTFDMPCNHPAVITLESPPQFPPLAVRSAVPMDSDVAVSIDEFGEVVKLSTVRKSGSPALDDAVFKAAMASNYFPAVKDCTPIPQDYIFREGISG